MVATPDPRSPQGLKGFSDPEQTGLLNPWHSPMGQRGKFRPIQREADARAAHLNIISV